MANNNYVLENDKLTLKAKGLDIGGTAAQFNGLARAVTGNFDHFVFVTSQENTDLFAKAGIAVFEKPIVNGVVDASTRLATLVVVPNGQLFLLYRTSNVPTITQVGTMNKTLPLWLRFKRDGANLVSFFSTKPLSFVGSHDWQQLTIVENFFAGWTNMFAGMMGLSHTANTTSSVVFQGLNFKVGLPYEIDFNIEAIEWTRAFKGLSALIKVQNSTKIYQLSIDNATWTNNNVFEDLTEGQTYTFYVRDSNAPDQKVFKTDKAPVSGGCSMAITTLQVVAGSPAGTYNVTVGTSNPDGLVLEFKMDSEPWKNNGTYTGIAEGSHTFSVRNRDKTTCVKTRTETIGTAAITSGINEIAEIEVPAPQMLNQVDLAFLGEWDVPLHPNPKYADQRVFESILKGPSFRHQVSTVGNIFKKGWTGIDYLLGVLNTEWQTAPFSPTFVSTLNIRQTSVIDGGPSYPQLELENERTPAEIMAIDYGNYIDITNDYASNIPQKFNGSAATGSKYRGKMVLFDTEGGLNRVPLFFGMQDYVNRVAALHKAVLDGCGPDTLVGFMYQGAPKQNVGFGFTRASYDEPADEAYTMVCAATQNSTAKNFPSSLLGKSIKTLDKRILAVVEVYFKYEAVCVPEGTQLKSLTGENLRNQNGSTMPVFTHFGVPQNDGSQANYKPSYLHWATHTDGSIGLNKKHLPADRFVLIQTNNFNAGYFFTDFGGTPTSAIIQQHNDGFARYKIPNYIVAGIEAIAFFSGALYYQWESAVSIGNPENRSLGETLPPYPQPSRLDYHGLAATQAMAKRLVVEKAKVGSQQYKMIDLIDGTEIYPMENLKVNYLTRAGFTTPKKIYPTDWMAYALPPVKAIVHLGKKLIAIWATVAYPGSTEVKEFEVIYDENGYNFRKKIRLSDYKNSLHIFSLEDTDPDSGGGDGDGGTVTPPAITSNPSPVTDGIAATFSTVSGGLIKWYLNGSEIGITGLSVSDPSPNENDYYQAKRTVNGVTSGFSNTITVGASIGTGGTPTPPVIYCTPDPPTAGANITFRSDSSGTIQWFYNDENTGITGPSLLSPNATKNDSCKARRVVNGVTSGFSNIITVGDVGGVTITEPTQVARYFADGKPLSHYNNVLNLPKITEHNVPYRYSVENGCVIIENARVRYLINLEAGGQVCGAFIKGNPFNFVYNGYDLGFQVETDWHMDPVNGYVQNGKTTADCPDDAGYNVTHGGSYSHQGKTYTPSLIDYKQLSSNSYYVKVRPLLYTLWPGEFSETYIETTYTLVGDVLKCSYKFSSFRTNYVADPSLHFHGQSVPACFLNSQLTQFQSYLGTAPWTGGALTTDNIPTSRTVADPRTSNSSEHWGFAFNPNTGLGFGVMNQSNLSVSVGITYKQGEVAPENGPGGEFGGGWTYVAPTLSMPNWASGTVEYEAEAFIAVGNVNQVRGGFKAAGGH